MGVEEGGRTGGGRREEEDEERGQLHPHFHNGKVKRTSAPNLSSPSPACLASACPLPLPSAPPLERQHCTEELSGEGGSEEAAPERAGLAAAAAAQAAGTSLLRAALPALLPGRAAGMGRPREPERAQGAAAACTTRRARLSRRRRCAPCPGRPPPRHSPMEASRGRHRRALRPAALPPLLAYLLALAAPGRGADEPVWRSCAIGAIAVSWEDGVRGERCRPDQLTTAWSTGSRLYRDQAVNAWSHCPAGAPARPWPGSSFSKLLLPYREGAAGLELPLTGWTFDRAPARCDPGQPEPQLPCATAPRW